MRDNMRNIKADFDWTPYLYDGDEEQGIEADKYLDAVAAAISSKVSWKEGSGRSDEYVGFGEEINLPEGYVDWYLFLRGDAIDGKTPAELLKTTDFVNVDVTIAADVKNASAKDLDNAESKVKLGGHTSDSQGYQTGSETHTETRPDDLNEIQKIVLDFYGTGDKFTYGEPEKTAAELITAVNKIIAEAKSTQDDLAMWTIFDEPPQSKSVTKTDLKPIQHFVGANPKRLKLLN